MLDRFYTEKKPLVRKNQGLFYHFLVTASRIVTALW